MFCTELPDALWLYGLVAGDHPGPVALPDVGALRRVALSASVDAVVGPAVAADWTGPEAESRLSDIQQLAPLVTAHHAVVSAWHHRGAILPVGFAALYRSDGALREALSARASVAAARLLAVADHDEVGVKATLFRKTAVEAMVGPEPPRSSGAAYLRYRRARRDAERALSRQVQAWAADLAGQVQPHVSETRQLATRATQDGDGEPAWSWALLRPRRATDSLQAVLAQARATLEPAGLSLHVTDPLPPWSFSSLQPDD